MLAIYFQTYAVRRIMLNYRPVVPRTIKLPGMSSGFGLRDDPTDPGSEEVHTGIDLAALNALAPTQTTLEAEPAT